MALHFGILIAELCGLFIVSKNLTQAVYTLFLKIFRHRSIAVSLVTALYFPGTVIHELSHLFTAEILGVKTGKLTLAPESINKDDITVGSVEFETTDPFRRSIIGLAPFFWGMITLSVLSSILPSFWSATVLTYQKESLLSSPSLYALLATIYVLFTVSNTMFASKTDMKGVVPLLIVLGILGAATYISGIRIGITGALEKTALDVLSAVSKSLSVVLLLNLILFLISSAATWGLYRLRGKK